MAREPIRWDNVALPQFNNSALAVASGAFTSSANDAGKIVEALRQRKLDQQAQFEKDQLNQALAAAYADNQITESDFRLMAGTGVAGVSHIQDALTATQGRATSAADEARLRASAAFEEARTKTHPAESQAQIAAQRAAAGASNAAADTSRARLGQINEERTVTQYDFGKTLALDKKLELYKKFRFGEGEGTLNGMADAEFSTILQNKAIEEAQKTGKSPEEYLQSLSKEELEEMKRQHRIDYKALALASEDTVDRIVAFTDMSPDEIRDNTAWGEDEERDKEKIREVRAAHELEMYKEQEKQKVRAKEVLSGNNASVLMDGSGAITFGEPDAIKEQEAIRLARSRYKLDNDDKTKLVRDLAPNRGAFESALTKIASPKRNIFGDYTGEMEFPDDDEFNRRYEAVRKQFKDAAGQTSGGSEVIESKTSAENLANRLGAAWSGKFGTPPAEETPETSETPVSAESSAKSLEAAFKKYSSLTPEELKKAKNTDLKKATEMELDALTQSLKNAMANLPSSSLQAEGVSQSNVDIRAITELLKESKEMDWKDRRGMVYQRNMRLIQERLSRLYAMGDNS